MARVILFGALQDVAGWRERSVEADSLQDLKTALSRQDARLGERLSASDVMSVINQQMVRGDHSLEPDDEVAFAPPVSGG